MRDLAEEDLDSMRLDFSGNKNLKVRNEDRTTSSPSHGDGEHNILQNPERAKSNGKDKIKMEDFVKEIEMLSNIRRKRGILMESHLHWMYNGRHMQSKIIAPFIFVTSPMYSKQAQQTHNP